MKFILAIIILNTLFVFIGCTSVLKKEVVNYTRTINEVRSKIEDLTWIEEPLTIDISKPIVENPELYMDSLIVLLKDPKIDTLNKEIALVLMINLDKDNSYLITDSISKYLSSEILKFWITGAYGNRKLKRDKDLLFKKYKII